MFFKVIYLQVLLFASTSATCSVGPAPAGFYMPDSLREVSFRYTMINNLILLPVTVNDTIQLNLILDTGCRNLVLFGKRFQKLFSFEPDKQVQFSGLGDGRSVSGNLALGNKVAIDAVLGTQIPIVVVPRQNVFRMFPTVDGVIGYDIFTKFEVEINASEQRITFRPAATAALAGDFIHVPIRIEDSRPLIDCRVIFTPEKSHLSDLMIDTGSTLGLLLKTTSIKNYAVLNGERAVLGRGFNGLIEGIETRIEKLMVNDMEIRSIRTGIIQSPWHNYASIGMDILKDYTLVLNYCKGYAGFRKS